ncbi:SDR family NAD(P)-dependent oxidoreductase [Streptomyces sp. NPDC002623]
MTDILTLENGVALVTGGGQGVGRQVALHFAAHGAKAVIVNDFVPERAAAVAAEVEALGAQGIALAGEVTDFDALSAGVEQAVATAGGLDILVDNAGPRPDTVKPAPFWETGPEDWGIWLGTNLHSVLNTTRVTLPAILASGNGSIINVISDAGRVGEPHLPIYSAAKAGVGGFGRAPAKATGAQGVWVNAVWLASVNTPDVEAQLADPEAVTRMLRQYITRRLGELSDVANMILFLVSDASGWITRQTYPANGGYSFGQ